MPVANRLSLYLIVLMLAGLSACGGGGGGGAPSQSKVFAADEVNGGVGSTENGNPTPGTQIAITRIITGPNTQIPVGPGCFGCLPSLALDSVRDQLYVSTNNNVLVFNNAGTASGNIAPSRMVGGTGFGFGRHLQLNAAADVLYVSNPNGTIFRIDNASTANSLTSASRVLTLNSMNPGDTVTGIALDATNDVLYVAVNRNSFGSVAIVLNVSAETGGGVTPDAELSISNAGSTPSITVDGPRNRLFVANNAGQIFVFDNARTLTTGSPPPSRTIQLPFSMQHRLFLETTNDRLYASAQNRVVIINNAGTTSTALGSAVMQLSTINSDLTAVVARP